MLLEQWEDLKMEIADAPGLLNMKFHELWANRLVHKSDEYPLPLRLVVRTLFGLNEALSLCRPKTITPEVGLSRR